MTAIHTPARIDSIGPDTLSASQDDVTLDVTLDEATGRSVITLTGDHGEALSILMSAEAEDALHMILTRRVF